MDSLGQLASACLNLAAYIEGKGQESDLRIVRAQVELIQARHEVVSGVRSQDGSLIGG